MNLLSNNKKLPDLNRLYKDGDKLFRAINKNTLFKTSKAAGISNKG